LLLLGCLQAWVVERPTSDGTVTSLELYDADGNALTKFFDERKPGRPEREDWRAVVNGLGRENGAA
jgi:putative hemin transport protein